MYDGGREMLENDSENENGKAENGRFWRVEKWSLEKMR